MNDEGYETGTGERSARERYLLDFNYRQPLPYQIGSYISLNYSSDRLFRKDFFREEYDEDSQPRSYLHLNRRWDNIILSLEVQPRLNDFYRTTEKLPEAKLQVQEFPLGESDFYYQGENSYAYLTRKDANETLSRYEAARFDTYHQLNYTRKFFGWLNILPSTSLRYDYYTRGPGRTDDSGAVLADDFEADPEEPTPSPTPELPEEKDLWRRTFSAELEISTDIYGLFPSQSEWLDIYQLRHVITPSVKYIFTDNPTIYYTDIYQFDSIDRIERKNYFLLEFRNQLQTKRGEGEIKSSWTLVDFTVSTPLFAKPDRDNAGRLIGDFTGNLRVNPFPWLGLDLDLLYNSYDNRFMRDTLDIWLRPDKDWWLTFSHNYRSGRDRNRVSAELYLRINPVWAFQVYGRYDTLGGRFEEESFTIYRDLHCWSTALEFERRDDEDDYSFFLSFWIKEFSQAPIRLSN